MIEEEKRFERNIQVVGNGGMNQRSSTKMMNLGYDDTKSMDPYSRNGTEIMRVGGNDDDIYSKQST